MARAGIFTRTKAAFRAFTRAYGGYDVTGGSTRWPSQYVLNAPIAQTLAAYRLAGKKIAHLAENNPLVASIVQNIVTAAVADGPTLKTNHPDPEVNTYLQNVWNGFYAAADVEGTMSLGGYLSRAVRGFVVDGESFTKLITDPVAMSLKVQLLTPDQVDSAKTIPSLGMTGDTPNIVAGVEFDSMGRRVAFWIFPTPPDSPWASVEPAVRVPATDICHVFEPRFPGVPRGMSPLAAVAPLAMELDQAHDAAITKLKTTALVAMILRDLEGAAVDVDQTVDPNTLHLEPGATLRLPPGTDATFPPTAEMSTVAEVLKHMSRLCCAGAGVPHFMATSDYGEVNYSSAKMGLAVFQRRIKAIQQNHIVAQLLNPIWQRLVLLEILSGRLRAPDFESNPERYGATFLFPGWPALDELKAAKANTLNLAAKVTSREQIIAETGRDAADVFAEIESDPFAADDVSASATNIANQVETQDAQ